MKIPCNQVLSGDMFLFEGVNITYFVINRDPTRIWCVRTVYDDKIDVVVIKYNTYGFVEAGELLRIDR